MGMKLKEWRKKRKLTQEALAEAIQGYARENHPTIAKPLSQRTLGHWESGTVPRKWWLNIIKEFTNGQVSANDFAVTEHSPEISHGA